MPTTPAMQVQYVEARDDEGGLTAAALSAYLDTLQAQPGFWAQNC
jgi:hypothetical protein